MRIHISETTHRELLKAGIYHMTKRGDINVKVPDFLPTNYCNVFIMLFVLK